MRLARKRSYRSTSSQEQVNSDCRLKFAAGHSKQRIRDMKLRKWKTTPVETPIVLRFAVRCVFREARQKSERSRDHAKFVAIGSSAWLIGYGKPIRGPKVTSVVPRLQLT